MKLRLKEGHFDTSEEIHAESQEVINTLTFENFKRCMKYAGIAVYMPNVATPKETVETRSYGKLLFYGQISRIFG
jgi:hypothetical protein